MEPPVCRLLAEHNGTINLVRAGRKENGAPGLIAILTIHRIDSRLDSSRPVLSFHQILETADIDNTVRLGFHNRQMRQKKPKQYRSYSQSHTASPLVACFAVPIADRKFRWSLS